MQQPPSDRPRPKLQKDGAANATKMKCLTKDEIKKQLLNSLIDIEKTETE